MNDKALVGAVFDCNVHLQAAAREKSVAAECLRLVEKGFVRLYLGEEILTEVEDVLNRPEVRTHFQTLTDEIVEAFLLKLRKSAKIIRRVPKQFKYSRDPDDEPYIFGLFPLLPSGTTLAFKPVGTLRVTDNDITHTDITEDAIKELIVNDGIIPDINRIGRTSQKAIDNIKWANARTDLGGEYISDAGHFTGEAFAARQRRRQTHFQRVISALEGNNVADARENLGRALHALQDFYSHSNWIELGNTN
jgi:hypothetical protein